MGRGMVIVDANDAAPIASQRDAFGAEPTSDVDPDAVANRGVDHGIARLVKGDQRGRGVISDGSFTGRTHCGRSVRTRAQGGRALMEGAGRSRRRGIGTSCP